VVDTGSPLQTAVYGTDGRVSALSANTTYGKYYTDVTSQGTAVSGTSWTVSTGNSYGVTGIGISSSMTAGTSILKAALRNYSTQRSAALSDAKAAISTYGGGLAQIMVEYGVDSDATFNSSEWQSVVGVVSALNTAVGDVETAMKYAVIAYLQSVDASAYSSLTVSDVSFDSSGNVTAGGTDVTSDVSALSTYITSMVSMKTKVEAAQTAIDGTSSASSYTFAQVKNVLQYVMDTDSITVFGMTLSEIEADTDHSQLLSSYTGGNTSIVISTGSGLFADIADFAGTYSSSVTVDLTNVNTSSSLGAMLNGLGSTSLTMTASTSNGTTDYATVYSILSALSSNDASGAAATVLSDLYAYQIDLAVRTNASGSSNLLLSEATNRISGGDSSTEGSGSTFTVTSTTVGETAQAGLVDAIRVVFMDGSGTILGIAKVDSSTGKLVLYEATVATDGTITFGSAKSTQSITSLSQNVTQQVSVLVFLDGDYVDNGDVAASGTSLTGTLNLQFASDAVLTPMSTTAIQDSGSGD
ncbi:MAG: hypothetical protein LUD71_03080, partial [Clostridiales bacterium]|nr:hypothetical protein [Clostridiales bacterium]